MVVSAKDIISKIAAAWFPVMAFIASGFEHCVANMFIIPAGITASLDPTVAHAVMAHHPAWDLSTLNTSSFIFANLIPVTLGNIFSGAVLVGGIYWFLYVKEENREYAHLNRTRGVLHSYFDAITSTVKRQYRYIKILFLRYKRHA
jgi:formate/nitrite transporter FocA (FNT family)